jgi:uncharacterized Zn finger protein (UPF0148 family)
MSYETVGISVQVFYTPAYCHRCGCVVFVRHETGSYTGTIVNYCPLCGGTDVEEVSPRLANVLQSKQGGKR